MKLRREPRLTNPTVVVAADWSIVADQISQTFRMSGIPTPERISTAGDLHGVLTEGAERTVITTLETLERAISPSGREAVAPDSTVNLVVIAAEIAPSEHVRLGRSLSQVFPGATLIGFSGGDHESGSHRRAPRVFGEIIDSYSVSDAVTDSALVPIWYEARLSSLAAGGDQSTGGTV